MKKILIITTLFFLLAITCSAKNGDITGTIYSTDILATVNGTPVESFNIGGKTAIILEDLTKLGAEASYDNSLRTLLMNMIHINPNPVMAEVQRGTVGKVLGNLYESDIVTYYNGIPLQTFSLNGRMAAVLEEIGKDNDYSAYGAKFVWDGGSRTIKLDCLTDNSAEADKIIRAKGLFYKIKDDKLLFYKNDTNISDVIRNYNWFYNENKSTYPLYYNGNVIAEFFPFLPKEFSKDKNGKDIIKDSALCKYIFFDLKKLSDISLNSEKPTCNEVLVYFMNAYGGVTVNIYGKKSFTLLAIMRYTTFEDKTYQLVCVDNLSGDYHDYAKEIPLFRLNGDIYNFTNVSVDDDNETAKVEIDSNTYIIEFRTGNIRVNNTTEN